MKKTKPKKRKKFKLTKKNVPVIILAGVFGVLAALLIISQIYISRDSSRILTEIATADAFEESLDVEIIAVRDETPIFSDYKNVASAVDDGTRVGVGATVAYAFSNPRSAGNVVRMTEIKKQIDYYGSLVGRQSAAVGDVSSYDDKIDDSVLSFATAAASGDFSDLETKEDELRDAITNKQKAQGVEIDISGIINSLESEYDAVKSAAGTYDEIKADKAGYYIGGSDGYESVLDYNKVDEWTIKDVENAVNAEPAETPGEIGRVVHDYSWYMAFIANTSDIEEFNEGELRTVSLPETSIDDFSAFVYSIKSDRNSGKSLVVLKCLLMNENLASLRREKAKILIKRYEGYRVDSGAIRVNGENEKGVYIVKGGRMYFRKLEIEYSGDGYCIVSNPYLNDVTRKRNYINLYDEYIVEGKNLSEGKII